MGFGLLHPASAGVKSGKEYQFQLAKSLIQSGIFFSWKINFAPKLAKKTIFPSILATTIIVAGGDIILTIDHTSHSCGVL